MQRLQVGLLGLAAMLLLVGLASIIKDRVRIVDAENGVQPQPTMTAKEVRTDPLADIGVIPSADPSASFSASPKVP